jgi:serine/threonine protein kinase, bacterial
VLLLVAATFRGAAPPPVTFAWPTSIALEPGGSLLVAENSAGRIVRVDPRSGRKTVVAGGLYKPYAVARSTDGTIYWSSGGGSIERLRHGVHTTLLNLPGQIGPMALGPGGSIYFTTETRAFRLVNGRRRLLARGLDSPHGIAVTTRGDVLISDRGSNRVLRIANGRMTTLIHASEPSGLALGRGGAIYLVEAGARRVGRYSAGGTRLADVGPLFTDPYDVAVAADGTVYVLDTAAAGTITRIAAGGGVSTVPTG